MGKKWMPFAEAVARAGSLEALLVPVREGRIPARGRWASDGSKLNLTQTWWNEGVAHDIDPAAGQAKFWTSPIEGLDIAELVIGIEFWRATVEALWPANIEQPQSAPESPLSTDARERPEWKEFLVPLLNVLRDENQLPNKAAAYRAVERCLTGRGVTMSKSSIYEGLNRHHADWWRAKPTK